jgi:hypothetical protein
MDAIPPDIASEHGLRPSGITCPDCGGVLQVTAEGRDSALRFVCRVGHVYAVPELLAAEEQKLEFLLWQTVTAFEEMVSLLRDLERHAARHGRHDIGGPHDGRLRLAETHTARLRSMVEENRPVVLARSLPSQGFP